MAITFTEQRKLQQNLATAVLVLVVVTSGVVWWGFVREPGSVSVEAILPPARTVTMNFDVFESSVFAGLAEPALPPDIPEEVGRENPFLPL